MSLRERQRIAAAILRECRDALARSGATILQQATGETGDIAPWRHYPEGEVFDPKTHCQCFYHSHGTPDPAECATDRRRGQGETPSAPPSRAGAGVAKSTRTASIA